MALKPPKIPTLKEQFLSKIYTPVVPGTETKLQRSCRLSYFLITLKSGWNAFYEKKKIGGSNFDPISFPALSPRC